METDKISKIQMHEESLDFTVSIKLCVCGSQYSSLSAAEQYVEHLLWNIDIYQPQTGFHKQHWI